MRQLTIWPAEVCGNSLVGKLKDMGMPDSMIEVFNTLVITETDWWNLMFHHPQPCIHEVSLRWGKQGTAIEGPYVCIQCGEYVPEVWAQWVHATMDDEELTISLPQTTQTDLG